MHSYIPIKQIGYTNLSHNSAETHATSGLESTKAPVQATDAMQSAIRYFARTASGKSPIPLCANCYNEAFRPESWEKLQGLTGNPRRRSPSSDNIHEGEWTFAEVSWGGERLPHRRDPVLRIRRPVKEWTDSAGSCSLCRIVCDLDSGAACEGECTPRLWSICSFFTRSFVVVSSCLGC